MRTQLIRIAAAVAMSSALMQPIDASAAVVRCTTADGRVIYQDSTCPNGMRGQPVDETPNKGFRFAEEKDIRRLQQPPREETVERRPRASKSRIRSPAAAAERRSITTGTSIAEVRRKIGAPDHIVRPPTALGKRQRPDAPQRWVYLPADEDPQTTTTLTVKGGMVLHVERKVTR